MSVWTLLCMLLSRVLTLSQMFPSVSKPEKSVIVSTVINSVLLPSLNLQAIFAPWLFSFLHLNHMKDFSDQVSGCAVLRETEKTQLQLLETSCPASTYISMNHLVPKCCFIYFTALFVVSSSLVVMKRRTPQWMILLLVKTLPWCPLF